jgi:3-methyladenine DNA glycosylase AlkD
MLAQLKSDLERLRNHDKSRIYGRFFKTGKGEYGEGDKFLGINVPTQRRLSRQYKMLPQKAIERLIKDPHHECRAIALMILVDQYRKTKDEVSKKKIAEFYLKNAKKINNWDLVDISAPNIPGDYLFGEDKSILYRFARSNNLWERRIAIMATFGFIKKNCFEDTFKIAEILLKDKHDLIHKAVGWMLREIGKRDRGVEERFLKKHYSNMPRTMLRYAIEKFDEKTRQAYLKGRA